MYRITHKGQSMLEYAIILALIVLITVITLSLMGSNIKDLLNNLSNYLSNVVQ